MRTADYKPDAFQHVMKRKRRHDRARTECGKSGDAANASFVSPSLAVAREVVAAYPCRAMCRACELIAEEMPNADT